MQIEGKFFMMSQTLCNPLSILQLNNISKLKARRVLRYLRPTLDFCLQSCQQPYQRVILCYARFTGVTKLEKMRMLHSVRSLFKSRPERVVHFCLQVHLACCQPPKEEMGCLAPKHLFELNKTICRPQCWEAKVSVTPLIWHGSTRDIVGVNLSARAPHRQSQRKSRAKVTTQLMGLKSTAIGGVDERRWSTCIVQDPAGIPSRIWRNDNINYLSHERWLVGLYSKPTDNPLLYRGVRRFSAWILHGCIGSADSAVAKSHYAGSYGRIEVWQYRLECDSADQR